MVVKMNEGQNGKLLEMQRGLKTSDLKDLLVDVLW